MCTLGQQLIPFYFSFPQFLLNLRKYLYINAFYDINILSIIILINFPYFVPVYFSALVALLIY